VVSERGVEVISNPIDSVTPAVFCA
jgi:hypothetical protein